MANRIFEFPCTIAYKSDYFDGEITVEMALTDEEISSLKDAYKQNLKIYESPDTLGVYAKVLDKVYKSAIGFLAEDDYRDYLWAVKKEGIYPDSFLASPLYNQYVLSMILRVNIGYPKEISE